jgi:pimeloyl-ACP methyl ester carboxylesterase
MKYLTTICLMFILMGLYGQGMYPEDWGLKAFQIQDPEMGTLNYYVSQDGLDEDRAILLLVTGVRGLPFMLLVETLETSTQFGSFPPNQLTAFADDYHVVLVGKPGTPFSDTLQADEINPMKNLEAYEPSAEYIANCGMEWEIAASTKVIDHVLEQLPNASGKLIALGVSEGGQLVPRLAHECDRVTHLVSLSSTSLNQFYSSIINRRMDAAAGIITHQEAQEAIDTLFAAYRDVYSDPESTERWYYGHPYKRWGSFCSDIPLEHMLQLDIPILQVKGTEDRNSPVLHTDYLRLEFLRHGKDNLTCKVVPGMNHWLMGSVEKDGEREHVFYTEEIYSFINTWIENH